MGQFFTRERYGRPQFLAGILLLMFVGQCVWLIARGTEQTEVRSRGRLPRAGRARAMAWRVHRRVAVVARAETGAPTPPELQSNEDYDPNHSPLWYLVASAPLLGWEASSQANALRLWIWLQRIPYIMFGVLLGASLWYVSRRLYGNAGGYIALSLYCFSPAMVHSSTLWLVPPEMGAAWSAFGAVFTAVAVAHTLYAPREVILWNWRRILLLGLSLALAIGSQFSLIILLPLALAFMLYLAPTRRLAASAIWLSAGVIAFVLLYASYFFRPRSFWQGMRHASFFGASWKAFAISGAYKEILFHLGHSSPALLLALPITLIAFCVLRRARYFGNIAPLLSAILFMTLAFASPHYPGPGVLAGGRAVPLRICRRGDRRFAGNSPPGPGAGLCVGTAGRQRSLEFGRVGARMIECNET